MIKEPIKRRELGFGRRAYSRNTRLITNEGDINVVKEGISGIQGLDIYHELITITWFRFISLTTALFFSINLIFALLYYSAGEDGIAGRTVENDLDFFLESFYFSTQTITTVGFGQLSPNSDFVSIIAAFESFLGLLGFAIATGLMFARFSRPRRNIKYSTSAIIAPYRNGLNGLMFRFVNTSKNQLVEAEVDLVISYWSEVEESRIFEKVELERTKISFFSTSWTVVHPITERSPLYNKSEEECQKMNIEVIIMFKAFDDTYVRQVYDRMSYLGEEIVWGHKFEPIYEEGDDDRIHIDVEKLSDTKEVPLN